MVLNLPPGGRLLCNKLKRNKARSKLLSINDKVATC